MERTRCLIGPVHMSHRLQQILPLIQVTSMPYLLALVSLQGPQYKLGQQDNGLREAFVKR